MQNFLQQVQYRYGIYNTEIEPEHETDYPCGCLIHQYQRAKYGRFETLKTWSKAVMYPGELKLKERVDIKAKNRTRATVCIRHRSSAIIPILIEST
jgi:hypothetical protein